MAFTRNGYGQVEPNQLSAQKTGQIYASLPLDANVKVLQNGEFMYYDYASGKVVADDSTGMAEPMLVFNEIKLYEPFWRTSYKDFAMIRVGDNYVTSQAATAGYGDGAETTGVNASATWTEGGESHTLNGHTEYPYRMDGIAPRLFKTNVGDIYTTNMVKTLTGNNVYAVGDTLQPKKNTDTKTLQLEKVTAAQGETLTGMVWVVVKVYTMPDGQPGLKLQRVQ
jgi:hypothetical protein